HAAQRRLVRRAEIAQVQPGPAQAVPALTLQRVDQVDPPAGPDMRCRGPLVERDRLSRCRSIAKVNPQVTAVSAERLGASDLDGAAEEQGLAVADAERSPALDFVVEARFQIRD